MWFAEAEQAGLRTSLELATAGTALQALHHLRPELDITINISPDAALSGRLGEILLGVDLDRVVLELTEHAQVTDYPGLTAALAPWRRAGARVAVDDAGGGYASFAHILSLSPEFIKLDISLIRDIHIDRQRQALTRAITGFATELGITVVAEGIETSEELEAIAGLGTAMGQGFHLGRPRPLDEQPELLSSSLADAPSARARMVRVERREELAEPSEGPRAH